MIASVADVLLQHGDVRNVRIRVSPLVYVVVDVVVLVHVTRVQTSQLTLLTNCDLNASGYALRYCRCCCSHC